MFTVPLKDQYTKEFEHVEFECEISKPDRQVAWYKNGEEVPMDARIEITVDGCIHKMIINEAYTEDSAEYTVKIGDQQTSAKLVVEGR